MRVLLLVNPRSGRGRAIPVAAALERELHAREVGCIHASVDEPPEQISGRICDAERLVVVGGDGTVRSGAVLAARAGVPLAVVPMGTENLAAREFGFVCSLKRLAECIALGRVRRVDLGVLNDTPFVLMASAGIDADVVHALSSVRRGPITRWSYVVPTLRLAGSWEAPAMRVTVDGALLFEGRGQLVVGNCRHYAAGLHPTPAADPTDGWLDATVLPGTGSFHMARWALRLMRKGWSGGGAALGRGSVVHASFGRPVWFQVDGDPAPGPASHTASATVQKAALALVDMR